MDNLLFNPNNNNKQSIVVTKLHTSNGPVDTKHIENKTNKLLHSQPPNLIPPGHKDDKGKSRLDLIPFKQLDHLADVLEYGSLKYSEWNWSEREIEWNRQYAATMRHLIEAQDDPYAIDPESGLPHIAHALSQLVMRLYWLDAEEVENETLTSRLADDDYTYKDWKTEQLSEAGVVGVQDGAKTPGKI